MNVFFKLGRIGDHYVGLTPFPNSIGAVIDFTQPLKQGTAESEMLRHSSPKMEHTYRMENQAVQEAYLGAAMEDH